MHMEKLFKALFLNTQYNKRTFLNAQKIWSKVYILKVIQINTPKVNI